ncbi:MAG: hypothetical protein ABNH00_03020 [Dokdonia sp.]|jgi:hypothetical protein
MNTFIKLALAATLALFVQNVSAQETTETPQKVVEIQRQKEKIVTQEREALRKEVEAIMKRLDNKEITAEEAEVLKRTAAQKHALNIENKTSILDNQIALLERNPEDDDGFTIKVGWGERDEDGNRRWGIHYEDDDHHHNSGYRRKYDRRTTSDFVLAFGLNNAIGENRGLDDSPYQIGGSRFAELGVAWKTRVFKNTGWLRVKYGFSFQFNGLNPTDDRLFVEDGAQTVLEDFDGNLDKAKLRMDNLVIPIHFEIGPYKKRQGEDYVRYSTYNKFKLGIGGYAGLNLGTRQKLKYKRDGDKVKEKQKGDFNTNNFIYGLSSYIAWGGTALYVKYDLNTIFKNNVNDERMISLGLRFDMD